jgi:[ribosomal protein S5]-alanine N-acetyltransferase
VIDLSNLFRDLPTLETPRLILRKLRLSDAQDVFAYASDPEVTRFVAWEPHRTVEDSLRFLGEVIQQYEDDAVSVWGITLKSTRQVIGNCGFVNWYFMDSRAEIGYAMGRPHWGQGLMTEAVRELVKFGFETMLLNRLEARCEPANVGSERVMQKVGMTYEGTLREHMFIKGSYRDLKLYSLLRAEYGRRG